MLTVKSFFMEMLGENTYLLHDETKQAVLIDCGVLHPQEKQAITDYVTAHQLQITQAWQTHGHFDHIFGCQWAYETSEFVRCSTLPTSTDICMRVKNFSFSCINVWRFLFPPWQHI